MEIAELSDRLLESYVPLRALTADHLQTLMRDHSVESILPGKVLFQVGDTDQQYIYLLQGELLLESAGGQHRTLAHDDPSCRFPIAHEQPRRDKALALTDCSIIRFNAPFLDNMLSWDQAAASIKLEIAGQPELDEEARWMLSLLDSNLFHKVPPVNVREVLHAFRERKASAGEVIVAQGEAADTCYYLKQGEADVRREAEGETALLASIGPGRVFGEDALVNDTVRNATVVMRTDGVLMMLGRQDFYRLLRQPDIASIGLAEARQIAGQGGCWVDVRTQDEFEAGHAPGALNVPLGLLHLKAAFLEPARPYVLYCNSGRRSAIAQYLLGKAGFQVSALRNGFEACTDADRAGFLAETGDTRLNHNI